MKLAETVRKVCKDLGITMSELARRTGQSPQNLSMKLKRDSVSYREFISYMDALGVDIDIAISYPDGGVPEVPMQDERAREKLELLEANLEVHRRNAEYEKRLNVDLRTALNTAEGYVDMALKHREEPDYMVACLEKARKCGKEINMLLDRSVFNGSVSAEHDEIVKDVADSSRDIVEGKIALLVEDNEFNREITKDLLEDNGVITETAENGEAALEMVKNAAPGYYSWILMDIQMPGMDGIETARSIRALPNRVRASVPIIAVTANAFEESRKEAYDAGMDDYLTKPLNVGKLVNTLIQFL